MIRLVTERTGTEGTSPAPVRLDGRRAWAMWLLAAAGYMVAVFHRMSLSVAAVPAEHRLGVGPAGLASLGAVEVGVYLLLQIPSGLGADRLGPRKMLSGGLLLMAVGSAIFAFASDQAVALSGRLLVGAGDALMFVSVLRVAATWFSGRRFAFVVSLTAVMGGIGQLLATLPLAAALGNLGWTGAFVAASLLTAALGIAVAVKVSEGPGPPRAVVATSGREGVVGSLRAAWQEPGTRLGFWAHFGLVGSFVAFSGLWGVPYLMQSGGYSQAHASVMVGVVVASGIALSPLVARQIAGAPHRRGNLITAVTAATSLVWAAMVAVPLRALPSWVVVGIMVVFGLANAASVAAFDLARTSNPPSRGGAATGTVNMAGFAFAVIAELATGGLLHLARAEGLGYSNSYRIAFAATLVVSLVGLAKVRLWGQREANRGLARPSVEPSGRDHEREHAGASAG